jgi:tetratricopeptide (TPR) repeat protein
VTALAASAFFITARFRFPLHVLLALAAAAAIATLVAATRAPRGSAAPPEALTRRRLFAALTTAALAGILLAPAWFPGARPRAFGEFHFRLGQLAEEAGREEEARREYRRALDYAPGNGTAAIRLGILTARAGELDRARPLLESGLALDPHDPRGWLALGQIQEIGNDLAVACSLYARAWNADSTYLRALEAWATGSHLAGETARAESLATELLERAGGGAPLARRCRFLLARIAERRRHGWDLRGAPERARADLALAVGDLAAAGRLYRAALSADPGDLAALLALQRIAAARGDAEGAQRLRTLFLARGGPAAALAPDEAPE